MRGRTRYWRREKLGSGSRSCSGVDAIEERFLAGLGMTAPEI
jgi:hypothetical protein